MHAKTEDLEQYMLLNKACEKMKDLHNNKIYSYNLVSELEQDEQREKEEHMLAKIIAEQNPEKDPESFYSQAALYNPMYRKIAEKGIKKEWLGWKLPVKSLNQHLALRRTDQSKSSKASKRQEIL